MCCLCSAYINECSVSNKFSHFLKLVCIGLDGSDGLPGQPGFAGIKGSRGDPGIAEGGIAGEVFDTVFR